MKNKVFFRADGAPEIGLGHVRRCAVLAKACREFGVETHLIARWRDVAIKSTGDWAGARIHEMPWDLTPDEDAQWVVETCREFGIRKGVIDHYRLSGEYQERLSEAGVEWMQFGNTGHAHPLLGRWVHDASPGAEMTGYEGRAIGAGTDFLLGPEYALVSEGFRNVRAMLPGPKEVSVDSILITFGGGDDCGATMRVLGWLDEVGFAGRRLVLTGEKNGSFGELFSLAAISSKLEVEVGNWDPVEIMASCQMAVCAGGTTLHELACLGLSTVVLTIAGNQKAPAEAWQRAGFGVNLGEIDAVEDVVACGVLASMVEDSERRLQMAQRAWEEQDGLGAQRVAQRLVGGANGELV